MSRITTILSVFALLLLLGAMPAASQMCTTDADCTDPSLPICGVGGMCEAAGPMCSSDTDCPDPSFPICDPDTNMCVEDMGSADITINNVTVPPGLENIEYVSGGGAWPGGCVFEGGSSVFLDDGGSASCTGLSVPETYGIIEASGPFTAELSCNLPVTPQVPGVISFTREMQDGDMLNCTVTNTAIPISLNQIFPNFPGPGNAISFDDAGSQGGYIAIIWGFQAGNGTFSLKEPMKDLEAPCEGAAVGILNPRLLGVTVQDINGSGALNFFIPPIATGLTVGFQAISLKHCITSNIVPQVIGVGPN